MKAYARQAKNKALEADAAEIRMRATRRLDQMRQEQKATIGLSLGSRGSKVKGARVDEKPTLAQAGIDNPRPASTRTSQNGTDRQCRQFHLALEKVT